MENLKWLREQGELMNLEELELFVPLTIEESIAEFLVLYNTVAFLLHQTQDLEREEDEIYFSEMAMRLERARMTGEQNDKIE